MLQVAVQRLREMLADITEVAAVYVRPGDTNTIFVLLDHEHYDRVLMERLLDAENKLYFIMRPIPDIHYIPMMGEPLDTVINYLSCINLADLEP